MGDEEPRASPRGGSDRTSAQRSAPVDDDDEDGQGGRGDRREEASEHDPGSPSAGRELVAAWLLLLLMRGESYGYDCTAPYTISIWTPTQARSIASCEHSSATGWLQSRWTTSTAGPRRRVYELTSAGRNNIGQLAEVITPLRDIHAAFWMSMSTHRDGLVTAIATIPPRRQKPNQGCSGPRLANTARAPRAAQRARSIAGPSAGSRMGADGRAGASRCGTSSDAAAS